MCSIGGFISSKPLSGWTTDRLITALLYYGSERGSQSAGVFVNDNIVKKAMDPSLFAVDDDYLKVVEEPTKLALVHTRWPTCGGEEDMHAQPFRVEDTIAIHNGWISNMRELSKSFNISMPTGVDSELIPQFVNTYGIRRLPSFLKSVYGCSACAILYKGELYFMRSGNPTAYTIIDLSDGNTVLIFASTGRILRDAIHYSWLLPPEHPIMDTKEGVLLRVTPDGFEKLSERIKPATMGWSTLVHGFDDTAFENEIVYPESPYYRPRKWTDEEKEVIDQIKERL